MICLPGLAVEHHLEFGERAGAEIGVGAGFGEHGGSV